MAAVKNIGIANLQFKQIEKLVEMGLPKPGVLSVNTSSHKNLCNQELQRYSEENDILLLTHTDCTPFITANQVNQVAGEDYISSCDTVLRYRIIAKHRSVLLAK